MIGAQFGVRRSPESRDKSLNKLIEIFIHSRQKLLRKFMVLPSKIILKNSYFG